MKGDDPASRQRFLLLIGCFLLFNIVSFSFYQQRTVLAGIAVHGTGSLSSGYFLFYLFREFHGASSPLAGGRLLYPLLAVSFPAGLLVYYLLSENLSILKAIVIPLPVLLAVIYCIALHVRLKSQLASMKGTGQRLVIFSGYAAVIFMTCIPLIEYFGNYLQISYTLINVLFLLSVGGYVYRTSSDARRQNEHLVLTGFFSQARELKDFGLTKRQLEIADLILRGHDYSEISGKLFLAEGTVRKHASNILRKTGTPSVEDFKNKFAHILHREKVH